MQMKLFDSELKVMEVLWRQGDCTAKQIAEILGREVGWNRNTTYTLIKRCIDKGAIRRSEPHFQCHPLIDRAAVQSDEADALIDKLFDGSVGLLFSNLIRRKKISPQELSQLQSLVDSLEEEKGD